MVQCQRFAREENTPISKMVDLEDEITPRGHTKISEAWKHNIVNAKNVARQTKQSTTKSLGGN